ncbi:restriction endonuclease subunit S [Halomonas sp. G15]|uniref:restriction endonuclease subunit S n=1 Tax=Halomonas sp. G15 TaxID=2903521 RepID=UPI0022B82E57|nr:restriction endonuclease subunit S [Halomonas sp. G15]
MREGWKSAKLGEVSEMIKRGIAPKYIDAGGVCVINQKCIRDHSINYDLARRHNVEVKKVPQERFIQLGDVLVNSTGTGTLGRVAQVRRDPDEPATVDTHVTIVRPVDGVFYHDFFGYMLIKIEDEIINSGEGASGQTELPRQKLENQFFVSFPESIEEQKRIVAILDEAFEGIDTVVANTENNLANVRELFDGYLSAVFAQRGDGWVDQPLKDVCVDYGRGKSKHRPRNDPMLYGGDYPFIQTGDVRKSNHVIKKYSATYNEAGLAQSKLWLEGTICITIAANIAETGILGFDACFPDSIIGLVVDEKKASKEYVEYLLQSVKTVLKAKGKGSAQDNINLGTFEKEKFPFPPLVKQVEIAANLHELSSAVSSIEAIYQQKLTALAELKQSLLQKAFSGELTAKKAEAAVEEETA